MADLMSKSGHLFAKSGHLVSGSSGCSCCPPVTCTPCAYCPCGTPTAYTVTFTGISLPTGCVGCGGFESVQITSAPLVNGTYTLAYDATASGPTSCCWTKQISGSAQQLAPDTGDCTGPVSASVSSFTIQLCRGSGGWSLTIIGTGNGYFSIFISSAASANCLTVPSFTNTQPTTGIPFDCITLMSVAELGNGGTATVTAVGPYQYACDGSCSPTSVTVSGYSGITPCGTCVASAATDWGGTMTGGLTTFVGDTTKSILGKTMGTDPTGEMPTTTLTLDTSICTWTLQLTCETAVGFNNVLWRGTRVIASCASPDPRGTYNFESSDCGTGPATLTVS